MNVNKSIYVNSMVICMEEMKLIGRRIKTLRMGRGVSQLELAEAIGMSQTNLSNVESGRTASTIQVLLKIRKVLNCKLSDFFADIDNVPDLAYNHNITLNMAKNNLKKFLTFFYF